MDSEPFSWKTILPVYWAFVWRWICLYYFLLFAMAGALQSFDIDIPDGVQETWISLFNLGIVLITLKVVLTKRYKHFSIKLVKSSSDTEQNPSP